MIDILLVLLIIFMVVAPTHPVGLPAAVTQHSNDSAVEPQNPVVVEIGNDRGIRLNSRSVQRPELGDELARIYRSRADRTLFVRGASDLEFGEVAEVIDIARGSGVDRTALLTASDSPTH